MDVHFKSNLEPTAPGSILTHRTREGRVYFEEKKKKDFYHSHLTLVLDKKISQTCHRHSFVYKVGPFDGEQYDVVSKEFCR